MRILSLMLALGTALPANAAEEMDWSLAGHYRVRSHAFGNLFSEHAGGSYTTQQLRLQPSFTVNETATFTFMADALDGVVFGDNQSVSRTSLFAGNPTNTGIDGAETANFFVRRAWAEFDIPVGKIRVGRQPSNWGMGLLANEGTEIDDDFGENYHGSTYDRLIFLTRPLALTQGILGFGNAELPLFKQMLRQGGTS